VQSSRSMIAYRVNRSTKTQLLGNHDPSEELTKHFTQCFALPRYSAPFLGSRARTKSLVQRQLPATAHNLEVCCGQADEPRALSVTVYKTDKAEAI
jgi:hypothetical protein